MQKLLHEPELIADERFLDVPIRVANNKALKAIIEEWLKNLTVEEAVARIGAEGIPAAPILGLAQIANDPHIAAARGMFADVEHPVMGTVRLNASPVKLSDTEARIRFPSPTLGQHTEEVLREIGCSAEEIARLREIGAI